MVDGVARVIGDANLVAIVNTGDDADFYGLRVCPDLDICTYVLAGTIDARGWGFENDSFRCLEGLATYGLDSWFGLGDRDLATHIFRTLRLGQGTPLHAVTREICDALGVAARILPMSDDAVRTRITTPGGVVSFQEYLVKGGARDEITQIAFDGLDVARPAPGVLEAIRTADAIVLAPSSPVVSIGTILGVPGVRAAVAARRADCVAVSPIVARKPVEGPAHKFLAGAGYPECSATQMATMYADVAATFVLDVADADETTAIEALGVRPVITDILMPNRGQRERLAGEVLDVVGPA
jgi:LPPG:FO 2-phospho-L-lactate transferase